MNGHSDASGTAKTQRDLVELARTEKNQPKSAVIRDTTRYEYMKKEKAHKNEHSGAGSWGWCTSTQ